MKFRTQLISGNGVVLALMIVVGAIVYFSVTSLIENAKWVEHTHEVIGKGEELVAEMVNMETGMRGFLVGGKDAFLEPYKAGSENFDKVMAYTKNLVNDNPAQVARLDEITKLARQWDNDAAKPQIDLKRKANEGALVVMQFKEIQKRIVGKKIFDNMREVIKGIDSKFARANNVQGLYLI